VEQNAMNEIMDRMDFSECRLMLAEDDPDDVILLRKALGRAHLSPPYWVARHGDEVLEFLSREEEFDSLSRASVLLLDLNMPRMDGFEVLEWIRKQPSLQSLIVVVLSSSDNESDVRRAYRLGANSYVFKPGSLRVTAEQIKKLLTYWMFWNHPERTPVAEFAAASLRTEPAL
jgi:CheY-like chemotaxis protein